MKVTILRDTVAGGIPVFKGQTVEVSPKDFKVLLSLGKATSYVRYEPQEPKEDVPAPELAVREPKIEKAVQKRGKARGKK